MRSSDLVGIGQEMWTLLTLYQALRTVVVDAAESVPGTDSGRCGFTIALQAARAQVVQAADVVTTTTRPVGPIGRRVLAALGRSGTHIVAWPNTVPSAPYDEHQAVYEPDSTTRARAS